MNRRTFIACIASGNRRYQFSDNFDRVDGAIGNGWISNGKWTISGNAAICTPDLGANLTVNGGFGADTDWTKGTGWTIAGGVAVATNVAGGAALSQNAYTVNNWYQSAWTILNRSAGGARVTGGGSWSGATRATDDTFTDYLPAVAVGFAVQGGIGSNLIAQVDNITVKQVTKNQIHALRLFPHANPSAQIAGTGPIGALWGLMICANDPLNPTSYIAALCNGFYVYLVRVVNGTIYNPLITAAVAYGPGKILKVIKSGTSVQLWYDNVQRGTTQTVSDVEINNNKYHGIFSVDPNAQLNDFALVQAPFDLAAASFIIAANNSTWQDKAAAQIICDGTADNVEIQTALTATAVGKTCYLMDGTYTLAAAVTQAAGTLAGQGQNTILNVGPVPGNDAAAITAAAGGTIRDMKIVGNVAQATGRKLQAANDSTFTNIWISNNNYGLDCLGCSNVTVTNLICDHIQASPNKWAAGLHSSAGTNGVTATNITITDSDRGIETENGAQNVSVDGATLSNIDNTALDIHTHDGFGGCQNISYKNITLDTYKHFIASGVDLVDDKATGLTLENITATNNQEPTYAMVVMYADNVVVRNVSVERGLCADGAYVVNCHHGDVLTFDGLTIFDAGAGEAHQIAAYTNVTGQASIVVQ
jgi:hypothetical protein